MAASLLMSSFAVGAGTFGAASLMGPEVHAPLNEPGVAFEDLAQISIPDLVRLERAADLAAALSDPAAAGERAYAEFTALTAEEMFHIEVSDAAVVPTPLPGAAWLAISGLASILAVAGRTRKARSSALQVSFPYPHNGSRATPP